MNILEFDMTKPRPEREVSPDLMKRVMREGIDKIVVKGDPDEDAKQVLAALEAQGHRIEYVA